MKTTYISTFTLSDTSRGLLMKQSANLARLQVEMSTGRKADIGLDLGSRTGEAIALRSEHTRLNAIIDTNALAASRLDVTQAALGDVLGTAQSFLATLVGVRDSDGSASVAKGEGQGGLDLLISRLNTQVNGNYLFAGLNTDVAPMANYFETPAASNKAAVDAAFVARFGFSQDDPAVSTISAADMDDFLTNFYMPLFDDPAWGADWSSASNDAVSSRISASETLGISVSANETAFRTLAAVFTMLADLGTGQLGEAAYGAVVDKAIGLLGEAIGGVTDLMSRMGIAQERVSNASDRLAIQAGILNQRINVLENVNPEETAVRLNTAITQLETTYAVSARIQRLSILNYL
ncbi:flagellar hook-associated family protein [Polymorphum gilvum]|uniref:Flagellin n=1 Tax=Polymorphum gilvum (strain LMG 25793 / CGMCC 1.9160 / SL003B-26A1) TaxID=991905 RepID=F2J4P1_POLGS|nr:flagellar hook-associated family protein [Polymorphum gilvum]ADZ72293.1 Flagellar hook-associated protein L [Polymorphum gilvum SL003B-26A1]